MSSLFFKIKALAVWQPEDVHLVRDILKLEHEPLNEVLKVDSLRPDQDGAENIHVTQQMASNVNTNFTKSGRPINTHPQIRWKPIVNKLAVPFNSAIEEGVDTNVAATMAANTNIEPSVHHHQKSAANADISELLTDVVTGKKKTLPQNAPTEQKPNMVAATT